ncbi:MAG: hypothetical protein GEV11_29240 [Streptosporangiales bacterium]|nr:hypothetical protein [Streptosporangiales bacterium]
MLLNVSALPPDRVGSAIVEMSAELGERGALFTVDGVRRRPHLTLFMARFPKATVDAVRSAVAALTSDLDRPRAAHTGFHLTPGHYYEASYRRTGPLMALHFSVLRALAGMRYSPGEPVVEDYFAPYTEEQRVNAAESGYDLAGELFRPHVTITRFPEAPKGPLSESEGDLSFEITRLGLFTADDLGATDRLIAEFVLSP